MDSASKTPSISEHPLRLEPESGIEMSTTICAGDGESKQSDDNGGRQDPPGPAKLPSERLTKDRLRIHKEFKIAYNRE